LSPSKKRSKSKGASAINNRPPGKKSKPGSKSSGGKRGSGRGSEFSKNKWDSKGSGGSGGKRKDGRFRGRGGRDDRQPKELSSSEALEKIPGFKKAIQDTKVRVQEWIEEAQRIQQTPYVPPENPYDELDPWQSDAVGALMEGKNVIVDAPTTAGKTRVVEAFFAHNISNPGFRACYTCPVKSLSNDKLNEFREMFGHENVGISTGDVKENLNAPIVVATLESYRNSLLGVEPDLDRSLVIFDEYHYIQDSSRGSAWEEAIILSPNKCQILLLSASLSNANEFAGWIETIHKRASVVVEVSERPVPLTDIVHFGGHWILKDFLPKQAYIKTNKYEPRALSHDKIAKRLKGIVDLNLTPTIIYAGKRLSCKLLAESIAKHLPPMEKEKADLIGKELERCHEKYKVLSYIDSDMRRMLQLYGVGFHHSGLQPPVRVTIEALVKKGLLRFCTATMGLSLGINFSVRSTLISDFDRPGEGGITPYGQSELLQMLGRAGRRGKDPIGYSLWPDVMSFMTMGGAKRERILSRLKNDPTTFLGLVGRDFNLKAIESFYKKSFLRYNDNNVNLSLINSGQLKKKFGAKSLPCGESPANAFGTFKIGQESPCTNCELRKDCHTSLASKVSGELAKLHVHLHKIDALDTEEKLTKFGSVAKYFPHDGGLYISSQIADNSFNVANVAEMAEIMAALSMARFKEPGHDPRYRFPRDPKKLEKRIEKLYPYELFPEIYDPPFGRRNYFAIRDFNPKAGYIIREWIRGRDWNDLVEQVSTEYFGAGDISAIIYRVASYLQSVAQVKIPEISDACSRLRQELLRPPLDYTL
jgi:superfamily II RNA helicase